MLPHNPVGTDKRYIAFMAVLFQSFRNIYHDIMKVKKNVIYELQQGLQEHVLMD